RNSVFTKLMQQMPCNRRFQMLPFSCFYQRVQRLRRGKSPKVQSAGAHLLIQINKMIWMDGSLHQHEDLLHGIDISAPAAAWEWPLAPLGEESRDYRIVHHVVAHELT
ncbi:MAG: hypothetical protein U5L46_07965, partial [Agrobacterium sp.]|nr:hypothetical protein [Agrobacterium sp.]